jgi:hypothetical protein
MLCKYCKDFDYDALVAGMSPESGFSHHATVADLEASAKAGCEICQLAIDASRTIDPTDDFIKRFRQVTLTCKYDPYNKPSRGI